MLTWAVQGVPYYSVVLIVLQGFKLNKYALNKSDTQNEVTREVTPYTQMQSRYLYEESLILMTDTVLNAELDSQNSCQLMLLFIQTVNIAIHTIS